MLCNVPRRPAVTGAAVLAASGRRTAQNLHFSGNAACAQRVERTSDRSMNIFPVGSTVADERNDIRIGLGTFFRLAECDWERGAARIGPRTFFGSTQCEGRQRWLQDRSKNIFPVGARGRRTERHSDRSRYIFQVDEVRSGARGGSDRSKNILRAGRMQRSVR
jgi:hypothetical protein